MHKELEIAQSIQEDFLPREMPVLAGFEQILAVAGERPAAELLEAVLDEVTDFRASPEPLDDYTLMLARKL